jgi:hypothetical protein
MYAPGIGIMQQWVLPDMRRSVNEDAESAELVTEQCHTRPFALADDFTCLAGRSSSYTLLLVDERNDDICSTDEMQRESLSRILLDNAAPRKKARLDFDISRLIFS